MIKPYTSVETINAAAFCWNLAHAQLNASPTLKAGAPGGYPPGGG
jgi:hypothetical protein